MALTDNITGYWKLDESSGNASDATGNSNTLTNNNTITYVAGQINNGALLAKASSHSFSITNAAQTGLGLTATDYTWSFWLNLTQLSSTAGTDYTLIEKYDQGTVPNGFRIYIDHTTDKLFLDVIGDNASTNLDQWTVNTAQTSSDVGAWHYWVFAFSFVGSNCTLVTYKDGSSTANTRNFNQVTTTVGTNTSPWRIGAVDNSGSPTKFYDGKIDEVGTWSRALSSAEVTTLWNGGAGLQYPFTSNTATVITPKLLTLQAG